MVIIILLLTLLVILIASTGSNKNKEDKQEERELSVYYQLRACGRGLSIPENVFRSGDVLYKSKEEALMDEAEFRATVTALLSGRLDSIAPESCHIYVVPLTIKQTQNKG